MVQHVIDAVQRRLLNNTGQALTAELAAGLFHAIADDIRSLRPERLVAPCGAYARFGAIEARVMPFDVALRSGLTDLHASHWAEMESERGDLRPDYQAMIEADTAGRAVFFALLDGSTMVGNFFVYVFPSTHTGTLIAKEDTLFIEKRYRKDGNADKFIRFILATLKGLGISELRVTTRTKNKAGLLFRRRYRFEHTADEYVRRL